MRPLALFFAWLSLVLLVAAVACQFSKLAPQPVLGVSPGKAAR